LKSVISSEEVVEGFFRCSLVHHLQERCELPIESLPFCINSSHRAVRRVCTEPSAHRHQAIDDDAWAEGWRRLQRQRGVNIVVPNHRSPRRADLYVSARNKVVSVEFKYIGPLGLRKAASCAAQIRLHAANHAVAFLLLYCGTDIEVCEQAVARLNRDAGGNVRILAVHGPESPVARLAAQPRLAADGGACKHLMPPRLKPGVDMTSIVNCTEVLAEFLHHQPLVSRSWV
jgi:hypothetical protein